MHVDRKKCTNVKKRHRNRRKRKEGKLKTWRDATSLPKLPYTMLNTLILPPRKCKCPLMNLSHTSTLSHTRPHSCPLSHGPLQPGNLISALAPNCRMSLRAESSPTLPYLTVPTFTRIYQKFRPNRRRYSQSIPRIIIRIMKVG